VDEAGKHHLSRGVHHGGAGRRLGHVGRLQQEAAADLPGDEALARGRAAAELGADAVFVEAPLDRDELRRIGTDLAGARPVANMVEGGRTPILSTPELGEMGFGLVLWGISAILAAGHALRSTYEALAATGSGPDGSALMTFTEITDAVGLPDHRRLDERYAD
jgi:2-methylisocitrate lyase-like PEP mutase family enzyme